MATDGERLATLEAEHRGMSAQLAAAILSMSGRAEYEGKVLSSLAVIESKQDDFKEDLKTQAANVKAQDLRMADVERKVTVLETNQTNTRRFAVVISTAIGIIIAAIDLCIRKL